MMNSTSKYNFQASFLIKLRKLLETEPIEIVQWNDHGLSFVIQQTTLFVSQILSKYFRHTKLASFQRQLNLYGFRRITKGQDSGAYFHPFFLRDNPELMGKIKRIPKKGENFENTLISYETLLAENGLLATDSTKSKTDGPEKNSPKTKQKSKRQRKYSPIRKEPKNSQIEIKALQTKCYPYDNIEQTEPKRSLCNLTKHFKECNSFQPEDLISNVITKQSEVEHTIITTPVMTSVPAPPFPDMSFSPKSRFNLIPETDKALTKRIFLAPASLIGTTTPNTFSSEPIPMTAIGTLTNFEFQQNWNIKDFNQDFEKKFYNQIELFNDENESMNLFEPIKAKVGFSSNSCQNLVKNENYIPPPSPIIRASSSLSEMFGYVSEPDDFDLDIEKVFDCDYKKQTY